MKILTSILSVYFLLLSVVCSLDNYWSGSDECCHHEPQTEQHTDICGLPFMACCNVCTVIVEEVASIQIKSRETNTKLNLQPLQIYASPILEQNGHPPKVA